MKASSNHRAIYILPVGFEWERLTYFPSTPDFCYLITQTGENDRGRRYVKELIRHLQSHDIDLEVIGLDNFFDLFELMSLYRWIAGKHPDDELYINAGGGTKLSAMGGTIIAGMYDQVNIFYPKMEISSDKNSTVQSGKKVEKILMLPNFPIKKINGSLILCLDYIMNNQPLLRKELLSYLTEIGEIDTKFSPAGSRVKTETRSPQSLYNILKRNYIDPLFEREWIYEDSGELSITELGRNILQIFSTDNFTTEKVNLN